jgi:hypothetical protein
MNARRKGEKANILHLTGAGRLLCSASQRNEGAKPWTCGMGNGRLRLRTA